MKEKNKAASELGKLSVAKLTKTQLKMKLNKATARSRELRKRYGYGYWKNPEIMKEIERGE